MSDEDSGSHSEARRQAIEQALRKASIETPRNSRPPAEDPAPELPWNLKDVVDNKYRLDRLLGKGGMGAVYAATHMVTHRKVAIKMMLPSVSATEEALERFIRESQVATRINHPAVVDVYDVGQHGDSLFLVMELLPGLSLRQIAEVDAPLDAGRAIDLLSVALTGLAAAHAEGIVHRDLKPDNIMVVDEPASGAPRVMVLDFGISKISSTDGSHRTLTRAGEVMGTPVYMSPEQISETKLADHRSDIYSMGVIMYELVEGEIPFDAETFGALAIAIATKPARSLTVHLPDGLKEWILKAMAREIDDRYQSADEMRAGLQVIRERHASLGSRATMASATPEPDTASAAASMRAAETAANTRTDADTSPQTPGEPSVDGSASGETLIGHVSRATGSATPFASPATIDRRSSRAPAGGSRALAIAAVTMMGVIGWVVTNSDEPTASPDDPATHAAAATAPGAAAAVAEAEAEALVEVPQTTDKTADAAIPSGTPEASPQPPTPTELPRGLAASESVADSKAARAKRRRVEGRRSVRQPRVRSDGKKRRAGAMDLDDF